MKASKLSTRKRDSKMNRKDVPNAERPEKTRKDPAEASMQAAGLRTGIPAATGGNCPIRIGCMRSERAGATIPALFIF